MDEEDKPKKCNCNDWVENIDKINGPLTFYQIRFRSPCNLVIFRFCPWCGNTLKIDYDAIAKACEYADLPIIDIDKFPEPEGYSLSPELLDQLNGLNW